MGKATKCAICGKRIVMSRESFGWERNMTGWATGYEIGQLAPRHHRCRFPKERRNGRALADPPLTHKRCVDCGHRMPLSAFYDGVAAGGKQARCKLCHGVYVRGYQRKRPDASRGNRGE